jgi:aminoglycoside phosphotransferase (APT) family kinase protein
VSTSADAVTALLDREFAHLGNPIEDLAWSQWIVRTHHPDHTDTIADFFDAYGRHLLEWPRRQAVMVAGCLEGSVGDLVATAWPASRSAGLS